MTERPMTRAEAMALAEEKRLVEQGYEFLDEKRVILAGEIMARLRDWRAAEAARDAALERARAALAARLRRSGLEALQVAPVPEPAAAPARGTERFLGVTLIAAPGADEPAAAGGAAGDGVAAAFGALTRILAAMAVQSANLLRLADEYRRTEQRAKALENILIPEIEADLRAIEEQLEAVDQEDAIRIRLAAR